MKKVKPPEGCTSGEVKTMVARSTMSAEEFLLLLDQPDGSTSSPELARSSVSDENSATSVCPQDGNDKSCG